MGESWSFTQQGGGVGGGELSPGSGSTQFSSGAIPHANTSGQLTANSSGLFFDSTNNALGVMSTTPGRARIWADPSSALVGDGFSGLWFETSAKSASNYALLGSSSQTFLNGAGGAFIRSNNVDHVSVSAGRVTIGSSASTVQFALPSTVNRTTSAPSSGGATALPANPMTYVRIDLGGGVGGYLPVYATNSSAP